MLLDTNAVSFYLSENRKYGKLVETIAAIIEGQTLHTCPIVEGEALDGAQQRNFGERRKTILQNFIDGMEYLPVNKGTVSHYTDSVWRTAPTMSQNDRWIASLVMQHKLKLLTLDSDFLRCNFLRDYVIYINPNEFI